MLQGRPPSLAVLPRLVYTRAILEEALRLYPPVPILSRQASATSRFRNIRSRPVPWCSWPPGCCTGTSCSGKSRTISCRNASCRRTPQLATNSAGLRRHGLRAD